MKRRLALLGTVGVPFPVTTNAEYESSLRVFGEGLPCPDGVRGGRVGIHLGRGNPAYQELWGVTRRLFTQ